MRYKERKEQSAELLRLALAEMGRHDASFTPTTFTVWYEHVAGINPRLSAAIAQQLKTEARFSNDTVERLHRDFVAEIDGVKAEHISDQFQQVMTRMVDAVEDTGDAAQAYGGELSALQVVLTTDDQDALEGRMQAVLDGTQRMVHTVQSLKDRASESQREIDALRADLERARVDATTCPLSRVLNRKGFDQRLEEMLLTPPAAGRVHGLAMFDIDHFKQVNDTHGHLMGDRVIQALGEVMQASVKLPLGIAARYGGEEFAVLMPSTTVEDGTRLAEVIRARIKAMKIRNRSTNEVLLTITTSAGVAFAHPNEDASGLIARADAALYRSKQTGRDRLSSA